MNRVWSNGEAPARKHASDRHLSDRSGVTAPAPDADRSDLSREIEVHLTRVLAQETKLELRQIDAAAPFHRYGLDSVVIVNVTARLEEIAGPLPKTLFFEHGTIRAVATALAREHGPAFAAALRGDAAADRVKRRAALNGTPAAAEAKRVVRTLFKSARAEPPPVPQTASEPMAIIGLSGRYPEADDLDEFWTALASGRDCISVVPRERWDAEAMFDPVRHRAGKIYAKWGGFLRDIAGFDHRFFGISRSEADFLDPQERLWLETAWHTLEDAGYTPESLRERSVGVFVGVMSNMYQKLCTNVNGASLSPFGSYGSIANRTSYQLDLSGPSLALDTMCSSSLTAIHLACESILRGESDVAIAGGVNVIVHPDKYVTQCLGGWFSSDGRCRSFGANGDGYVPGEGVGAVMLKRLSDAERDGDHIYGLVRASSVNHCGRTNRYYVPNPNAQAKLMQRAWARGGIEPRRISYFEAHGTGTSLGDPLEIRGISQAFEAFTSERQFCALGSVKSNVGHLESAAGIAALTKVLLQIKNKALVPSLHSDPPNPHISFESSPVYVQRSLEEWPAPEDGGPRLAALSSFGAGGSNAHLVIEEYRSAREPAPAEDASPELVLLSGSDADSLRRYAERWITFLERDLQAPDGASLRDIARTTQLGRVPLAARVAFVVESKAELLEAMRGYLEGRPGTGAVVAGTSNDGSLLSALLEGAEGADILRLLVERRNWHKIAQLWVMGVNVSFASVHEGQEVRRVPVPGYPFLRTRCWLPESESVSVAEQVASVPVPEAPRPAPVEQRVVAAPRPAAPAAAAATAPAQPPASAGVAARMEADVIATLAHVSPLPREQLRLDRRLFADLNLDSLMLTSFHSRMTQKYPELEVNASAYSEHMTVGDLVRILCEGLRAPVGSASAAGEVVPLAPLPSEQPQSPAASRASAHCDFELFDEVRAAREQQLRREAHGLQPLEPLAGPNGVLLEQAGAPLVNFTTYDFLGLARHPRVRAAASEAVHKYGASSSASRPVGGEIPLYQAFEADIARFLNTEKAVLFVSGHATNVTTMEILFGAGDLILFDEGSSLGSIVEGALISGAEVMAVPHRSTRDLDRILSEVRACYRKVLIAVEAVCTTDGSIADLPKLVELKKKHQTFLLVDEDNSFGVLGATGRGLCEHHGVNPRDVDAISCGLNKSLGSSGGFVAGDGALVHLVKCTATSLVFAASIAPMSVAAAHAALKLLDEEPQRSAALRANASSLALALRSRGWDVREEQSPLLILRAADDQQCLSIAARLRRQGFLVEHQQRNEKAGVAPFLRVIVTAEHTSQQLRELSDALGAAPHGAGTESRGSERPRSGLGSRIARSIAELQAQEAAPGPIPEHYFRVSKFPEYVDLVARQAAVPPRFQMYWRAHESRVNDRMVVAGKETINFSSFNYLSLSGNQDVVQAVQRAIDRHGTSASAPRVSSGSVTLHVELERELANLLGTEDAVVFDAGHNTNVSCIGNLFGPGDLVLHDALSHNSMIQGAILSGAARQPFPHNDYARVDEILSQTRGRYRRVCVLIEGVYSQDGDIPDLAKFIEIKRRHDALLFVDEAHSIGVIGETGRGVCEHAGVDPREVDILMGTLSKALGTSGGYVAGRAALVEYLRQIPCYVQNVNVSPPVAAAALEAIRVIRREPERVARSRARARLFLKLAKSEGLDTGMSKDTAVIPIMTYSSQIAYEISHELFEQGITAHPFTYPIVPEKKARLRMFVNSEHSEEQIEKSVKLLGRLYREKKAAQAQR